MNKITKTEKAQIDLYLSILKNKEPVVLAHVVRVARFSARLAKKLNKDTKAAWLGGLFHDIGKICLDSSLFDGRDITNKQYEEIKAHAIVGSVILKDLHLFTSLIAGLHHNMYKNGYGLCIKDLPNISIATIKKLLDIYTIVSVCDFIDAYKTRTTVLKTGTGILIDLLYSKFPNDVKLVDLAIVAFN